MAHPRTILRADERRGAVQGCILLFVAGPALLAGTSCTAVPAARRDLVVGSEVAGSEVARHQEPAEPAEEQPEGEESGAGEAAEAPDRAEEQEEEAEGEEEAGEGEAVEGEQEAVAPGAEPLDLGEIDLGRPAPDGASGIPIDGTLRARYRFRATPDEDDHDLYGTLTLDVGDPRRHPVTGHVMLWANLDLDEDADSDEPDPFFDITDTFDRDVTARIYHAYADVHEVEELDLLRVGRQPLRETPEFVRFDGVRAETRAYGDLAARGGIYGGVPVHLFESSRDGDAVFGTFVEARPWRGGRARLDWMHLEDDDVLADHSNDLFSLGWWQSIGTRVRTEAAVSWLEEETRDLTARASYVDPVHALALRASYYELFETQADLATELDPFFEALLEQFPFRRLQLLASKTFEERWLAEAGFDVRRLSRESDEGVFNREYERYHVRGAVEDVLDEDVTVSVTAELWDPDEGDVWSWAADVSKEWDERWTTSIGTYYALYDIDVQTLTEKSDVRVYFLGVEYDRTKDISFDVRYEFEDDDLTEYHVLRLGMLWRF